MRRVKIVSDGTIGGTKVIDAETGQVIRGVKQIILDAEGGGVVAHLVIDARVQEMDVEAYAPLRKIADDAAQAFWSAVEDFLVEWPSATITMERMDGEDGIYSCVLEQGTSKVRISVAPVSTKDGVGFEVVAEKVRGEEQ